MKCTLKQKKRKSLIQKEQFPFLHLKSVWNLVSCLVNLD
nr:MAG TPA: hypothetical protein [Caudoviricetes sp.]